VVCWFDRTSAFGVVASAFAAGGAPRVLGPQAAKANDATAISITASSNEIRIFKLSPPLVFRFGIVHRYDGV
jgi:hypothetical protein